MLKKTKKQKTSEVKEREKQIPYANTYIWEINGSEEHRGRTGIKTQMQRMDLRTQGGGSVSWDEVRVWHRHICTTKYKIDSQWEAAAQHREISSVLCDHIEGWDRDGGRETQEGGGMGIYIHIADSLCYTAETNTPL